MQRARKGERRSHGDGIYTKQEEENSSRPREIEGHNRVPYCENLLFANETKNLDANQNELGEHFEQRGLSVSREVVDEHVGEILKSLDEQVRLLDKLQQVRKEQEAQILSKRSEADPLTYLQNLSYATSRQSPNSDSSLLAVRRRLLDDYLKNNIGDGECGCHFDLNDERLLSELDECYRKFNQSDEEASLRSEQNLTREGKRRPSPSEQQVTSVTNEGGSPFVRLITAASELGRLDEARCANLNEHADWAPSGTRTGPVDRSVAHTHRQKREKLFNSTTNGRGRQNCSPNKQRKLARAGLFIDSEADNRLGGGSGGAASENRAPIEHRKIYEPRAANCQRQGQLCSWPCYCGSSRSERRRHWRRGRRGHEFEPRGWKDATNYLRREQPPPICVSKLAAGSLATARGDAGAAAARVSSPSDEEDSLSDEYDLDHLDIRSALDCVEESSPNWRDLPESRGASARAESQPSRAAEPLSPSQKNYNELEEESEELACQLVCSLTNDGSAASRSPERGFLSPGPNLSLTNFEEELGYFVSNCSTSPDEFGSSKGRRENENNQVGPRPRASESSGAPSQEKQQQQQQQHSIGPNNNRDGTRNCVNSSEFISRQDRDELREFISSSGRESQAMELEADENANEEPEKASPARGPNLSKRQIHKLASPREIEFHASQPVGDDEKDYLAPNQNHHLPDAAHEEDLKQQQRPRILRRSPTSDTNSGGGPSSPEASARFETTQREAGAKTKSERRRRKKRQTRGDAHTAPRGFQEKDTHEGDSQEEEIPSNYSEKLNTNERVEGERGESRGASERDASASMRAARDLVKLSVPSLSALQYLPGQLDVKPVKMLDSRASTPSPSKGKAKSSSKSRPRQMNATASTREIDKSKSIPVTSAESRETIDGEEPTKHEESCLFDRLCLCNCMARNHPPAEAKKLKSGPTAAAADATAKKRPATGSPASSSSSKASSPKKTSSGPDASRERFQDTRSSSARASPVADLHKDDEDVALLPERRSGSERNKSSGSEGATRPRAGGSSAGASARNEHEGGGENDAQTSAAANREKQSPTFLGLLKPSRERAPPRGDIKKLRGRQGPPLEVREGEKENTSTTKAKLQSSRQQQQAPRRFVTATSSALGSIGDLEASGRSSSASGTNSDFCSPPPPHSSRFNPAIPSRPRASSANSPSELCDLIQEELDGKRQACRNCKSSFARPPAASANQETTRKVPAYKRFLSPNKLFASPSQSSLCERCESAAAAESASREPRQAASQKSFLSRSLSRLSGRSKHRRLASGREPKDSKAEHEARPASACDSLSISASRQSHLDDSQTYSDSVANSSLEEINLFHSLPYEINRELNAQCESSKATRLLRTPEIVLSRVEYAEVNESDCSFDRMTRSTSGLGQQKHMRSNGRHSSRNHDRQLDDRRPLRHGSEISFNASEGSGSFTHGPFSLPNSPHSSRRNLARSPRLSQSPVPFHSPASETSKIEDGLRVCSTEHFEKHIGNNKENQIEPQKRLFTAWINHFAPNLIVHDLFVELQDGIKLIGLLATLTHDRQLLNQYERMNRDKQTYVNRLVLTPSSRLKHLSNVSLAIDYMRKNLGMKLVNLNPIDIVSGKANVILGLCWNIILNFQLDHDLLHNNSESSSQASSSLGSSRLSAESRRLGGTSRVSRGDTTRPIEEFSTKDLNTARSKLLAHINKRFNLKLTNLTSSLVDGDVLMAIIKQILPPALISRMDKNQSSKLPPQTWASLGDDEKLEYCFQVAQDYLNVPRLISASDLRQQTISENNSKPLLVYLSMLLKANPRQCSTDQMLELRQLDESLKGDESVIEQQIDEVDCEKSTPPKKPEVSKASNLDQRIQTIVDELESEDNKFHIEKLQRTLVKINQLDHLVKSKREKTGSGLDGAQLKTFERLKRQADQVESLIAWINEADKLLEAKQKSSSELAKAIEAYQVFFSPAKLPQIDTSLCPTYERQYRECLATARQRVLSMEQTMKNWISYEEAREELKNWFMTAESKLAALRPTVGHIVCDGSQTGEDELHPPGQRQEETNDDRINQHMSRLDDLVDFFGLEPIDIDDLNDSFSPQTHLHDGEMSYSSLSIDRANSSLSGSLLSLGSTGSRLSTLTSSKRAGHNRLFDNFELKCRLLAAMVEPEQRDALLMGIKILDTKRRHIIDHKVPQVINEIRLGIDRCRMSIQEQDEFGSESEFVDESNEDLQSQDMLSDEHQEEEGDYRQSNLESYPDDPAVVANEDGKGLEAADNGSTPPVRTTSTESPTIKSKRQKYNTKTQPKSKRNNSTKKASNNIRVLSKTIGKISIASSSFDEDDCAPYYRLLWSKIVRASKMSLSFNIVLLICLAGLCIVPLIQKDACCELSQSLIPDRFTVNQRPT